MDCVICKGKDVVVKKAMDEELQIGNDVIFVSLKLLVCSQCGERYYDRAAMRKLEKLERDVLHKKIRLKEIGYVLRVA
ncbi:MAG: YgiT-type zinc finger protein [Chlamydiae bacterium]|nr:YgiT-type zinc finger protein [Chlamydiota bacterium]